MSPYFLNCISVLLKIIDNFSEERRVTIWESYKFNKRARGDGHKSTVLLSIQTNRRNIQYVPPADCLTVDYYINAV